jgi:hypothetical protein
MPLDHIAPRSAPPLRSDRAADILIFRSLSHEESVGQASCVTPAPPVCSRADGTAVGRERSARSARDIVPRGWWYW